MGSTILLLDVPPQNKGLRGLGEMCPHTFTAASFTAATKGKLPKCPLMDKCTNKMWSVHTKPEKSRTF